jgi:hypothetical protein
VGFSFHRHGLIPHFDPERRERAPTQEEADRIKELTDVFLRQAQCTETPGYDPDN